MRSTKGPSLSFGGFRARDYLLMAGALLAALTLCVCAGSVSIPPGETIRILWDAVTGKGAESGTNSAILLSVRLPRVLTVALCGGALALCGAVMQGLLRNPLADGSTMGVSSGAALGAVTAILIDFQPAGFPLGGTAVMAMIFAFLSLALILGLVLWLDHSLSTTSIILIGVIFSMFASSLMSLMISLAHDKIKSLTFWTMGSFSGSRYENALLVLGALILFGGALLSRWRELNAFALGEENARSIGVPVRRTKLMLMICVSALIGVCVSVGGTIGFAGLVVPHILRMLTGPNHRRLLPASLFGGAVFLLLTDLAARMLLRPVELPIGVVTSLIGAVFFVAIFYRTRKDR